MEDFVLLHMAYVCMCVSLFLCIHCTFIHKKYQRISHLIGIPNMEMGVSVNQGMPSEVTPHSYANKNEIIIIMKIRITCGYSKMEER